MTQPAQPAQPAAPGRARRILLVDDDVSFTSFFKEFLVSHRPGAWVVHTADHYAPALACLKAHSIDLAVIDIRMPIMDGLQLLSLLKRTHPELPVVMLTSDATAEHRAQSLQGGAALFFDKAEVASSLEAIYAALEAVASAPTEGFRGMLRQVGLTDVVQMECLGRKSSILQVTSTRGSGGIYIEDGSIIHAEFGGLQGEPALFQLLGFSGGEFLLRPFVTPARQTIDAHWESLLMESARLHDEASASAPPAEPGGEAPAVPYPEPPPASAGTSATPAPDRHVREIVLCSNTGELFYEWQSPAVDRRIQLLNAMFDLGTSLAHSLALTRPERLEVEAQDDRVMILMQPDRRLFVRSGLPPGGAAK
jgi:DNA-binding NarL/FixJ family response regulator